MKKNYFVAASLLVGMLSFGQVGNSLRFDGVDDHVVIGTAASLLVGNTNTSTYEANVFVDASNTGGAILARNSWDFRVQANGSVLFKYQGATAGVTVTTAAGLIAQGAWNHIACVSNGTANEVYINGAFVTSLPNNREMYLPTSGTVKMGNKGTETQFYGGALDEVRLWNVARTPAQIAANKTTELAAGDRTGLVAYYQFNQGTAGGSNTSITTLTDSSVNNNPGTLTNFTLTGNNSNFVNTAILATQGFAIDSKTQIYPNPATNEVTINHTDLTNVAVKVTDISGKLLINQTLDQTSSTVSISDLNAGVYLFTITSNEGQTTKKIVKQ